MRLSPPSEIFFGLDIGGSKSHVRIVDPSDNSCLLDKVWSSTNWATMTDHERSGQLARIVRELAPSSARIRLVAGVHGNDSVEQQEVLTAPLRSIVTDALVLNDSNLLIFAHGKTSGAGLIAGTGSSLTATRKDGAALTVGGWGWILGDEGGAVGLVRDAMRQIFDAYDQDDGDTLSGKLLGYLDLAHAHELPNYLANVEPRVWAAAAHVIFEAHEAGSMRARKVIACHAGDLARKVETLNRRGCDVSTVVCAGGVIVNQPALLAALSDAVRETVTTACDVTLLTEPPVSGAINLARHHSLLARQSYAFS